MTKEKMKRLFIFVLMVGAYGICFGLSRPMKVPEKPNIVLILMDDMGWSDIGCYGGEIETPNIDALAEKGLRFTQAYNTAKCMPSRACLLTGVYAQQCGMSRRPEEILHAVTLGEVLKSAGYRAFASGKHHGTENLFERGFDHYYGLRDGACNYWNPGKPRDGEPPPGNKGRVRYWCDDEKTYAPYTPDDRNFYTTDAFTDKALEWLDEKELKTQPFLLYLAYTAPHYPLHAWPKDIEKYKGRYDAGYEGIREARYQRMIQQGLIDPAKNPLPPWDGIPWNNLTGIEREKETCRMEIYAAMLDCADRNIGRIITKLKQQEKFDNTLILFASDNGGCAESAKAKIQSTALEDFGTVASYEAVGRNWATVQNTPLRKWKNYSHEGGIRTPLIVCWPNKIKRGGEQVHQPAHLIDIMPTLVELTGATYPETFNGVPITPLQGVSLLSALHNKSLNRDSPLFWQWSNGGAVRQGDMKAVFWGDKKNRNWELYDLSKDRNEMNDLSADVPQLLNTLKATWNAWYKEALAE